MKRFRVTLRKPGARMTALIGYHDDDWPSETEYSGDMDSFRLGSGEHVTLMASLSRFEETARWQAERCGAEIEIEDLGGEAVEWKDVVRMPGEDAWKTKLLDRNSEEAKKLLEQFDEKTMEPVGWKALRERMARRFGETSG